MNTYLFVKTVHIVSSTLLFGTGIGSAFYVLFASRQRDPRIVHFVTRHAVIADWLFTTTAVIVQPLSGFYLAHLAGFPLGSRWIVWSLVLYLLAGACWLPAAWLQARMRDMARVAAAEQTPLPDRHRRLARVWAALGVPAFAALVAVFYLMVAKPV